MKKTTKWSAILHGKCPQCRRGDVFSGTAYALKLQHTNQNCSHCRQRFEIEPGYFYAAMYVSYAMNMLEMLAIGIATFHVLGGKMDYDNVWVYIFVILGGSILLSPFNYRYSRVILLHCLSPKIKYKNELDSSTRSQPSAN